MHEEHRLAAEMHERAAKSHRTAAEHNEKGGQETSSEWHAQRALEYSDQAYRLAKLAHEKSGRIEALPDAD